MVFNIPWWRLFVEDIVLFSRDVTENVVDTFDLVSNRRKLKVNSNKSTVIISKMTKEIRSVLWGVEIKEVRAFKYNLCKHKGMEGEMERTMRGRQVTGIMRMAINRRNVSMKAKRPSKLVLSSLH